MGEFRTAEICPNGHASTSAADQHPELREKYCSQCGEATMIACPACRAPIRGEYHVEGVFSISEFRPPAHCHNCGQAFPWTKRKVSGAIELLEVDGSLSPEELQQAHTDLATLTRDTPKTPAASARFKKTMHKVGSSVAAGVRDIVVDVLSETAKKAIWG
ncbi:MAG: DUF2321 domain-containing protein [Cyanobacteria bacterium SZAS LIN-2]|nr:DUF2321 domain-containing protein [Cyanobacteria bacterium SZAS LIN-2]